MVPWQHFKGKSYKHSSIQEHLSGGKKKRQADNQPAEERGEKKKIVPN